MMRNARGDSQERSDQSRFQGVPDMATVSALSPLQGPTVLLAMKAGDNGDDGRSCGQYGFERRMNVC